eukprot:320103-Chlamydomonas_euryale.AAC.2
MDGCEEACTRQRRMCRSTASPFDLKPNLIFNDLGFAPKQAAPINWDSCWINWAVNIHTGGAARGGNFTCH